MEQLAWTLSHHIGERWVRRGYHLGMPTRRTNQLFLKPQPWQSSDQIEFTQARQKVKAQVTQLPMLLPQLTRRTSQETTLHTRRPSSNRVLSRNQHETPDPRERPYKQGPLESPKSENHQVETTPQNPHPTEFSGQSHASYQKMLGRTKTSPRGLRAVRRATRGGLTSCTQQRTPNKNS
jgi:hypothetical protein